jgi:uncharacterized protein YuzE
VQNVQSQLEETADEPDDDNPYEYFTPPGVVGVSEAALTMARQFDEHVKRTISRDGRVVGFEWFTR